MLTQCPSCKTVFNVKPEQLKAAHGKVRCSRCHSIFNARENQYTAPETSTPATKAPVEKPTPIAKPQLKQAEPPAAVTEKPRQQSASKPATKVTPPAAKKPAAETPPPPKEQKIEGEAPADEWFDLTPSPAAKVKPVAAKKSAPPATEPPAEETAPISVEEDLNEDLFKLFDEPEFVEPAPAVTKESSKADEAEKQTAVEEIIDVTADAAASTEETESPADEAGNTAEQPETDAPGSYSLPPQLESRPVRATLRTLFLGLSNLILIAALVLQYAYQHRVPLRENETLRPWLDTMCKLTDCPMPPKRDPDKIELVDNMMQSHPRYQNSLLVTATLINRADYAQPYPIVEITMTDLQQKVVAQRTFTPEEYLAGDFSRMGFTPNVEVPLMLELTDPGNNAVGFKFDFY